MKRKIIPIIVIIVLLLGLTPVQAVIPGEDFYQPGEGFTSSGIAFSDIPETLSPEKIEEAGHIARLREEETGTNTAVFQNADGTNTLYFFAQDIWYETENGEKMDYTTDLQQQNNGTYINQSNTKTLTLPNRLSQGITYSENGFSIELVPSMDTVVSTPGGGGQYYSNMQNNTIQAYDPNLVQSIINPVLLNKPIAIETSVYEESGRDKQTALYENIYSSDVDIKTVPLLHGVRQDIIINDASKTSFSFKIDTNGLIPANSTGYSIALCDATGKEQMSILSEPIMDESGNISMNNILDIAPYPDGTYLVTLTVDQAFVESAIERGEEITIPLYEYIYDEYIYDTYVSNSYETTNYNSSASLVCGYYNGICHTYIRFLLGSAFNYINPDSVASEHLYLFNNTSSSSTTLIIPKIPNLIWNNTTLTWSTANSPVPPYTETRNGVPAHNASTVSGGSGYQGISLNTNSSGDGLIAAFIREGINPNLSKTIDQSRGIVLINSFESSYYSQYNKIFKSANASSGRPYVAISYDATPSSMTLSETSKNICVGENFSLSATVFPSSASQNVFWSSNNTDTATVSSSGRVTAKSTGTATITARSKVTSSVVATCVVYVSNLKIYQTINDFRTNANGYTAEDLQYNDKTYDPQIKDSEGNYTTSASVLRDNWENMCTTYFATEPLESVIIDMISHFMNGTGNNYTNQTLTNAAYQHTSTQTYINLIVAEVDTLLDEYNGDISALKYIGDYSNNRDNHPMVAGMKDDENNLLIYEPVFNNALDYTNGLAICVHSLWGNQIEVKSYNLSGNSYSGVLTFTLYDHFGLDEADRASFADTYNFEGFNAWYSLQHSQTYNGEYKPYVTIMEFDVSFSGTLN